MAHQNQICYLLPASVSLSHPRWHNYLFILVLALVRGPISPITWAWPHFSRPAHWIAPIMRWQPQVPYGQARSDPGCLSLSGNMCAHNWPLSSLMAHRFATRQSASSAYNEAYKSNWVFCQEAKSAIENECDKLKLSVERLENTYIAGLLKHMIRFLLNGMVLCKCLHTYVIFNIALSISHAQQLQTAVFIELLIIRIIMHMSK